MNITLPYNLLSWYRFIPPQILANFQSSSNIRAAETMYNQITFMFSKE